jgi:hypothetical protein
VRLGCVGEFEIGHGSRKNDSLPIFEKKHFGEKFPNF